jgi:hypothetical protein
MLKRPSFCQDRLGTNIGKLHPQKEARAFFAGEPADMEVLRLVAFLRLETVRACACVMSSIKTPSWLAGWQLVKRRAAASVAAAAQALLHSREREAFVVCLVLLTRTQEQADGRSRAAGSLDCHLVRERISIFCDAIFILLKTPSFDQDRLGTNIGNALRKEGDHSLGKRTHSKRAHLYINRTFLSALPTKRHSFGVFPMFVPSLSW